MIPQSPTLPEPRGIKVLLRTVPLAHHPSRSRSLYVRFVGLGLSEQALRKMLYNMSPSSEYASSCYEGVLDHVLVLAEGMFARSVTTRRSERDTRTMDIGQR